MDVVSFEPHHTLAVDIYNASILQYSISLLLQSICCSVQTRTLEMHDSDIRLNDVI